MKRVKALAAALLIAVAGCLCLAQPAVADLVPGENELEIIPDVDPIENGTWVPYQGRYYYRLPSGSYATGWLKLGDATFWLGSDGACRWSCWCYIDGHWRYFDSDGRMVHDCFKKIDGSWYCFAADGTLRTGLIEYGGAYYYASTDDAKLYIDRWFGGSGAWYYAGKDATLQHNAWAEYAGKYYYMNASYKADLSEGVFVKSGGYWYHQNADGSYSVGFAKIGGQWFHFDQRARLTVNQWVSYEGHSYYFGSNGALVDYR